MSIMIGQGGRRHIRPARIFGGSCDLVDERPLNVILAQLTRVTGPPAVWDAVGEPSHSALGASRRSRGGYRHDAAGVLVFRLREVLVAIRAVTAAIARCDHAGSEGGTPSDERGSGRHGRDRVTQVVLAVAERPLSMFHASRQ